MSLFDKTNQRRTASQNIAPFFPATVGESLSSAYDLVNGTQTTFAFHNMEYDVLERYRDQLGELTGDRLYNPLDNQAHFTAEAPGGFELQMEQFFEDVQKLREKNPSIPDLTFERLREDIVKERQKLQEMRNEVAKRETSFGNTAAGFIGGAGATLGDPLVLGSMAVGAPAATGVLRAAMIEAAIGAGSEVGVQAAVQATREGLGEGVDFGQAAESILMAGLGGGILAGVIRGGASGVRALLKRSRDLPPELRTRDVQAAEKFLERKLEMEENNPFGPTLAGQVEHARRMDIAMRNAVRPLRDTLANTTAVGRALPVDRNMDFPVIGPRETIEQYTERVRLENVPLFERVDAARQQAAGLDRRMGQVEQELSALPRGNREKGERLLQLRERVADLESQRQSTAVRRKLARNRRNLERLENDPQAQAFARRQALSREREELRTENRAVQKEAKKLQREVKKAVKNTPRRPVPTNAHVKKALDEAEFDEGTRRIAKFMADIAQEAMERSFPRLPDGALLTREVRSAPAPRPEAPLEIDPEIERAVKDEANIDAELARAVEANPDEKIIYEDPDTGAIGETTIRDVAEDLAAEEKVYREFEKCIREALS